METIKSKSNAKIKLARALRSRKTRDAEGLFVLEGIFHIGEAAAAGAAFEFLLVCPELLTSGFALKLASELDAQGIPVYEVSEEILAGASERQHPQGLLAVLRQHYDALSDLSPEKFVRGVAVVAPADPGNLGSLLRTIDAAGADGLILLDGGVDVYHPSALRAGMGAHFWKRLARASFADFAAWAQAGGYTALGSSAQSGEAPASPAAPPWLLLLGSEREGLSAEQLALCHHVLRIPMRGRVTSLNLAVAAGVMLYRLVED